MTVDYKNARADSIRQTITARFLATAKAPQAAPEGPLGLPAVVSLKSMRPTPSGDLNFSLTVPREFVEGLYDALVQLAGRPLAVTLEEIDLSEVDPFA